MISEADAALLAAEGVKLVRVGSVGSALQSNFEAFDEHTAAIYRAKLRVRVPAAACDCDTLNTAEA